MKVWLCVCPRCEYNSLIGRYPQDAYEVVAAANRGRVKSIAQFGLFLATVKYFCRIIGKEKGDKVIKEAKEAYRIAEQAKIGWDCGREGIRWNRRWGATMYMPDSDKFTHISTDKINGDIEVRIRRPCSSCAGVGDCPVCGGKGTVEMWIPVNDFLSLLLARIRLVQTSWNK